MSTKMRCLVVDDSAIYRKVIRDVLAAIPEVEVIGVAADGVQALKLIESHKPELVTLDLEMPQLDGIGVLRELKKRGLETPAIMVSAFTARGAQATTEALGLGAFDFILKPTTNSLEESVVQLRRDLVPKIAACRLRRSARVASAGRPAVASPAARPATPRPRPKLPGARPEIVAIGVSTGGPAALSRLLPQLPKDFPAPIVIVQHMPPMFTKSLAEDLDRRCQLRVMEATQGQPVRAGEVLIAPGDKQMRVAQAAAGAIVQLTDDPPERNCRPAADFLFRSVASVFGPRAYGVVLTGMGDDGTAGAERMKAAGATILAQDEASCVVYGMPKSVVDRGVAEVVAPLDRVHEHLIAATAGRVLV